MIFRFDILSKFLWLFTLWVTFFCGLITINKLKVDSSLRQSGAVLSNHIDSIANDLVFIKNMPIISNGVHYFASNAVEKMLTDFLYSKSENNIIAAVVTDKNNKLFALAMDRDRAFLSPWVKRHYTEMAPSLVNERKNNEDIFYNIFKSNLPVISIGSKINNKGTNVGNLFFLLDFNKIKNKLLPCQSKAIDVNIFTMEEFISNDIWMTKNVKISGDIVMSFKYGAKLLIVDDLWILIAVSILLFIVVLILKKTNFVFMWNSINLINPFSKELDESARNDLYKYAETLRISCKYANRPKLLD